MVAQYLSRRPSFGCSRTSPALHCPQRDPSKTLFSTDLYPMSPPSTPTKLATTPPGRWSPAPGTPLKGRRLRTLAVEDNGKRRWVVDLATGAKFWAVEMPAARRRVLDYTSESASSAPATPLAARPQRQLETPPRSP